MMRNGNSSYQGIWIRCIWITDENKHATFESYQKIMMSNQTHCTLYICTLHPPPSPLPRTEIKSKQTIKPMQWSIVKENINGWVFFSIFANFLYMYIGYLFWLEQDYGFDKMIAASKFYWKLPKNHKLTRIILHKEGPLT